MNHISPLRATVEVETVAFGPDEIRQTVKVFGDIISTTVANLTEAGLRDALISLGWTPPAEEEEQPRWVGKKSVNEFSTRWMCLECGSRIEGVHQEGCSQDGKG